MAQRREIKAIHARRRALGLEESEYRRLLVEVGGASLSAEGIRPSARDLTAAGRGRVLDELARLGAPTSKRHKRPAAKASAEKAPLIGKIRALLADANRPEEYAEAILRRMTNHKHRTPLEWGTPPQLYKVAQALMVDQRRRAKREVV